MLSARYNYRMEEVIRMRLFTAILFQEEMKDTLCQTVDKLKSMTLKGSFTDRDNLHLTINFIGETKRIEEVKAAMEQAAAKVTPGAFLLELHGSGSFKRREGEICFIGVEKTPKLISLQKELVKELKKEGFFDIDDHEYRPHLTIGRRVIIGSGFNRKEFEIYVPHLQIRVSKISLMKSERLNGKLTYSEIYHVDLGE